MRFSKSIKSHIPDLLLIALITVCFFIYFVIYTTPSRIADYRATKIRLVSLYNKITIHIREKKP